MKKIWKYIITSAVAVVAVVVFLACSGTFKVDPGAHTKIFRDLCNAFFIPGALFVGFGLLVFCTNEGAMDIFRFSFMKLRDMTRKDPTNCKYRTYYDYRQREHKPKSFLFLLIVGGVCILIAVIFFILFKKVP